MGVDPQIVGSLSYVLICSLFYSLLYFILKAVFAILSYVVAEIFLMSGIVAIMVCGIIMSRYVELNITRK